VKRDPQTTALFRTVDVAIRDRLYKAVEFLALRGMHARTIASVCGLSTGQVYTACAHMKIKLRDYRDGLGPVGSVVVGEGRTKARGRR
jgi:hypothetical protein